MKKIFYFMLLVITMVFLSGCCKRESKWEHYLKTVNWIVIKEDGGTITDVWLEKGRGNFRMPHFGVVTEKDDYGNRVEICDHVKLIEISYNREAVLDRYVEYHRDSDSLTYEQRYKLIKGK